MSIQAEFIIVLSLMLLSFIAGWEVNEWKMKASQLAQENKAIEETQQKQTAINAAEKIAVIGEQVETSKTLKLTGELKHDKALINCHIDNGTLAILRKASVPAGKLP